MINTKIDPWVYEFYEKWVPFFRDFNIKIDLSDYSFPENKYQPGYEWTIINPAPGNFLLGWNILKNFFDDKRRLDYIDASRIIDVYPYEPLVFTRCAPRVRMDKDPKVSPMESIKNGIKGLTFSQYCLLLARLKYDNFIDIDTNSECILMGSRTSVAGFIPVIQRISDCIILHPIGINSRADSMRGVRRAL